MDDLDNKEIFILTNKFWLPKNYTWNDLSQYVRYEPKYSLYYPVFTAIALYVIRIVFEK